LIDSLWPTLYFGREIVAYQGRFAPEKAFELIERHGVTHTFLFPTALKAMMKAVPAPRLRHRLQLQAIMSAGEAVGDAVFAYCRDQLGVVPNEMFGQTEVNYIVGNCALHWAARPGSMGRAYPGHRVAVIDDSGRECPRGTPGDVALHARDVHGDPDPVFFLGYWRRDDATRAKFTGDPADSWCRTGDTATMDDDGYLWYQGRSDDVFKAAGYRIGPSEIENCLVKHEAVANAAVVPKPTPSAAPGQGVRRAGAGPRRIGATRARAAGARARQAGAVRVPEGNRVHRRPAHDHHGQGAAARAAPARGRKGKGAAVGLTGGALGAERGILRFAQDDESAGIACRFVT
jgi:acyl-coenzyme A synthetase/AMP-(fatty) acid ligase